MAIVYIMASQDLISQFSQDSNAVPAAQSDRSRTPRRPHHAWHQTVPTFRGPMHYAMTTPRPFWHPAGVPPPPPMTSSFSTAQRGPRRHRLSHLHHRPFHSNLLTTQTLHLNDHTSTPRSPRPMSSPGGSSPIHEGYTCRPIEIRQWNNGNRTSIFMTPTRSMVGFPFQNPPKPILQLQRHRRLWILCKSHFGSSCTKDYTTHGSAVLPTAEKPSSSLLTR